MRSICSFLENPIKFLLCKYLVLSGQELIYRGRCKVTAKCFYNLEVVISKIDGDREPVRMIRVFKDSWEVLDEHC